MNGNNATDSWILSERYRIEAELGRGGMGVVYRAFDLSLKRQVAVKVLPPELSFNEQFLARFKSEILHTSQLEHQNIVSIYDVGVEENTHYYVMQYVKGQDLKSYLSRYGRQSIAETGRLLGQIAAALDFAHQKGIVHRDIKPENILIDAQGVPKLTDFGIARSFEGTRLTTGLVGTPEYMSPEQAKGEAVDGRSDLYSLAIVAYEMLIGTTPFASSTAQPWAIVSKHITEPPPHPSTVEPSIPPASADVLLRGLAKSPSERYGTCTEFVDLLVRARDLPVTANRPLAQHTEMGKWAVVLLESPAARIINTIKMVREDTGLGLKEAKDVVEQLPGTLRSDIAWLEAQSLVERYEAVGCRLAITDQAGMQSYQSPSTLPASVTQAVPRSSKSQPMQFVAGVFQIIVFLLLAWGGYTLASRWYASVTERQREEQAQLEAAKVLSDGLHERMQQTMQKQHDLMKLKGDMPVEDCDKMLGTWKLIDENVKQYTLPAEYLEKLNSLRGTGHLYRMISVKQNGDQWSVVLDGRYATDARFLDGALQFNREIDDAEGIWYDKASNTLMLDIGLAPHGFGRRRLQYYQ